LTRCPPAMERGFMSDELERAMQTAEEGTAVFIPSHLTKALVATGIAAGATGVAVLSAGYALFEYRRVTMEEIKALFFGGSKIG
jgi:6-phosphogluconate dehydrogenase